MIIIRKVEPLLKDWRCDVLEKFCLPPLYAIKAFNENLGSITTKEYKTFKEAQEEVIWRIKNEDYDYKRNK